jgi:branched-chain amino acid transport system substrate-binding protein
MNRNYRQPVLAAAVVLTVALSLTGCGSRLTYSRVLAENAALENSNATGSSGTSTGATNSAGGNSGTGNDGASSALGAQGSTSSAGSTASTGSTSGSPTSGGATSSGAGTSASSGAPCTGVPTESTVNVGQLGSDTGIIGALLSGSRTGAEMWATYVNQNGGLNCHKVNLITADDGGDPATAVSEIQAMIQQDHVVAIIAEDTPLSLASITSYAQSAGVPLIQGENASSQWYTTPDLFPVGSSIRLGVDGDIQNLVAAGRTKVGAIACVEFALICSNVASYVQEDAAPLGGQFVYDANVSLAQPDYTSECLAAQAAGAQALILLMDPDSQVRFANDCANQGYHPTFATINETFTPVLLQSPNTVGEVAAGPVFPYNVMDAATAAFENAGKEATGSYPSTELEAVAWVSGLVLQAAAQGFTASSATPAEVVQGLYQIKNNDFGGLTSPITYTSGQPTASPTCYTVQAIAQSGVVAPDGLALHCLPSSFSPVA